MDLVHCCYCSASAIGNVSPEVLSDILNKSRIANGKVNITGILLYCEQSFFQLLEGDRSAVNTLFEIISSDKRHTRVTKIIMESINEKSFAAWTMGYPKISSKDLSEISGLNDFFTSGKSFMQIGKGRAKILLSAFKEGKWRLSI